MQCVQLSSSVQIRQTHLDTLSLRESPATINCTAVNQGVFVTKYQASFAKTVLTRGTRPTPCFDRWK